MDDEYEHMTIHDSSELCVYVVMLWWWKKWWTEKNIEVFSFSRELQLSVIRGDIDSTGTAGVSWIEKRRRRWNCSRIGSANNRFVDLRASARAPGDGILRGAGQRPFFSCFQSRPFLPLEPSLCAYWQKKGEFCGSCVHAVGFNTSHSIEQMWTTSYITSNIW